MKKVLFTLSCIFCSYVSLHAQYDYSIDFTIRGTGFQQAILGYYYGNSMIPLDTTHLDPEGAGSFKDTLPLLHGLYFIYLGPGTIVDLIISDDQGFTFTFDAHKLSLQAEGCLDNTLFFDYKMYMIGKGKEMSMLHDKKIRSVSKAEKDSIDMDIQRLNKEVENHINSLIESNKNTFFSTVVAAARDIKIPDSPPGREGTMIDSFSQYQYYVEHYFDHFDLTDIRLLRTPIYNEKVENYLTNIVVPVTDSLMKAVDLLLVKTEKNEELFKNMLSFLMLYAIRNDNTEMDEVLVHLAEHYYIPRATWADETIMELLKKKVNEKKRIMRGQIAPDFEVSEVETKHFIAAINDSLLKADTLIGLPLKIHSINAEFTILYFWEADCGHCKEVTPELYKMYDRHLKAKGVEVLSVQMLTGREGKGKWIDFINKHQMYDWINAWQPYDYHYKELYNLRYSPVLYLLDKEKKIIEKNITPQQVGEIILLHSMKKD